MGDELATETRLMQEAKRLVSVGYWHMPDATEDQRTAARDVEGALLTMSVLHDLRHDLSAEQQQAGKLVCAELAEVLCGHMKFAVAEHHLNVRSIRDDVALNYVPAEKNADFTGQVLPHQIDYATRIAGAVMDATAPGGAWPSQGPDAWCSRSIARQMSQSVSYLGSRAGESSVTSSACATAAIVLAGHLQKHVADAVKLGLQLEQLKEPIHLPIYAAGLNSQEAPTTRSRGPDDNANQIMSISAQRNVRE
jgi:hypothetical protein